MQRQSSRQAGWQGRAARAAYRHNGVPLRDLKAAEALAIRLEAAKVVQVAHVVVAAGYQAASKIGRAHV